MQANQPYTAPKPVVRTRSYKPNLWQGKAEQITTDMAAAPGAFRAWSRYKPVSADTVKRNQLGLGVFPGGLWDGSREKRCTHPRLIVPLYEGPTAARRIAGFRCRSIDCDCTKWLSPGGSRMVLFNGQRLPNGTDVIVICENPIDALLIGQEWEGAAVATLGVSIWNDDYTAAIKAALPGQVVVWFDNDIPGQTTNPAIIAAWKSKRIARHLPDDETKFLNGIKLTNRLLEAGLNATFYKWPNTATEGADIGGFFK